MSKKLIALLITIACFNQQASAVTMSDFAIDFPEAQQNVPQSITGNNEQACTQEEEDENPYKLDLNDQFNFIVGNIQDQEMLGHTAPSDKKPCKPVQETPSEIDIAEKAISTYKQGVKHFQGNEYCEAAPSDEGGEITGHGLEFGIPDNYKTEYSDQKVNVNCRCVFQRYWFEKALVGTKKNVFIKNMINAHPDFPNDLDPRNFPDLDNPKSKVTAKSKKLYQEMTYHKLAEGFQKKILDKIALKASLAYTFVDGEWQSDEDTINNVCTPEKFADALEEIRKSCKGTFQNNFAKYFSKKSKMLNKTGKGHGLFNTKRPGPKNRALFLEKFQSEIFDQAEKLKESQGGDSACMNKLEYMNLLSQPSVYKRYENEFEVLFGGNTNDSMIKRDQILYSPNTSEVSSKEDRLYELVSQSPALKSIIANEELFVLVKDKYAMMKNDGNFDFGVFLKEAIGLSKEHLRTSCEKDIKEDMEGMFCNKHDIEPINYQVANDLNNRDKKNFQYHYCNGAFPYLKEYERPLTSEVSPVEINGKASYKNGHYMNIAGSEGMGPLRRKLASLATDEPRPSKQVLHSFLAKTMMEQKVVASYNDLQAYEYAVSDAEKKVNLATNIKDRRAAKEELKQAKSKLDSFFNDINEPKKSLDLLNQIIDETKNPDVRDILTKIDDCGKDVVDEKAAAEIFEMHNKMLKEKEAHLNSVELYKRLQPQKSDRAPILTGSIFGEENESKQMGFKSISDQSSGLCHEVKDICPGQENILFSCLEGTRSADEAKQKILALRCMVDCEDLINRDDLAEKCKAIPGYENLESLSCQHFNGSDKAMYYAVIDHYEQQVIPEVEYLMETKNQTWEAATEEEKTHYYSSFGDEKTQDFYRQTHKKNVTKSQSPNFVPPTSEMMSRRRAIQQEMESSKYSESSSSDQSGLASSFTDYVSNPPKNYNDVVSAIESGYSKGKISESEKKAIEQVFKEAKESDLVDVEAAVAKALKDKGDNANLMDIIKDLQKQLIAKGDNKSSEDTKKLENRIAQLEQQLKDKNNAPKEVERSRSAASTSTSPAGNSINNNSSSSQQANPDPVFTQNTDDQNSRVPASAESFDSNASPDSSYDSAQSSSMLTISAGEPDMLIDLDEVKLGSEFLFKPEGAENPILVKKSKKIINGEEYVILTDENDNQVFIEKKTEFDKAHKSKIAQDKLKKNSRTPASVYLKSLQNRTSELLKSLKRNLIKDFKM